MNKPRVIDLCQQGLCMNEATHRFHHPKLTALFCDEHVKKLRQRMKEEGIEGEALGVMLERLPNGHPPRS